MPNDTSPFWVAEPCITTSKYFPRLWTHLFCTDHYSSLLRDMFERNSFSPHFWEHKKLEILKKFSVETREVIQTGIWLINDFTATQHTDHREFTDHTCYLSFFQHVSPKKDSFDHRIYSASEGVLMPFSKFLPQLHLEYCVNCSLTA